MKVVVFVKATTETEAGFMPEDSRMMEAMLAFNQQLVDAGVLRDDADGLKPTAHAKRVLFDGDRTTVVDGPFAETKELVAGYWIWHVKDMDDAIAWARRCPNPTPMGDGSGVLEIRPVYELEDFGDMVTPEVRAQYDALHETVEARRS